MLCRWRDFCCFFLFNIFYDELPCQQESRLQVGAAEWPFQIPSNERYDSKSTQVKEETLQMQDRSEMETKEEEV